MAALTPSATISPSPSPSPTTDQTTTPGVAASIPPVNGTLQATSALGGSNPPASSSADQAEWVGQTPADETNLSAGQNFTITWRVSNTGTTTWTTDYQYRYFSGEAMYSQGTYPLPQEVAPGEEAVLTVSAVAPTTAGSYRMDWVLTNDQGTNFYTMYIMINVGSVQPTATTGGG
ncbi:MAG: hypothetical protein GYA17_15990 [Chloroflexi bacterium]|nr:hypothetical protein [Chloroflexota bacterium]